MDIPYNNNKQNRAYYSNKHYPEFTYLLLLSRNSGLLGKLYVYKKRIIFGKKYFVMSTYEQLQALSRILSSSGARSPWADANPPGVFHVRLTDDENK